MFFTPDLTQTERKMYIVFFITDLTQTERKIDIKFFKQIDTGSNTGTELEMTKLEMTTEHGNGRISS